ncbi:MAG: gluconokinase [Hyphomicrobiaceae bacterium]|nr:gluconokinase [Hyphomicrobiaceae bacterium]
MGVSGCGKSTTGESLAAELGWPFRDADSFHPPASIEKMRRGTPLVDEDRWPWLAAIAAWIDERRGNGQPGIVSCSALKRTYRRLLLEGRSDVRLVYLKGEMPLIAGRMARRTDHFMPPGLLASQFEALEEPGPDEWPITVPIDTSPRRVVEYILADMARSGRHWRE